MSSIECVTEHSKLAAMQYLIIARQVVCVLASRQKQTSAALQKGSGKGRAGLLRQTGQLEMHCIAVPKQKPSCSQLRYTPVVMWPPDIAGRRLLHAAFVQRILNRKIVA